MKRKDNKIRNTSQGFTLIELLVVISIIALLSSIIMAALSTARDKGNLAAAQSFATYTYDAFGSNAIGVWNFNEGGVGPPLDSSGNNLNFTQGITRSSSITAISSGYSADFRSSPSTLNYTIPNPGRPLLPSTFSYTVWVYPTSLSADSVPFFLEDAPNGSGSSAMIYLISSTQKVTCSGSLPTGNNWNYAPSNATIPLNKWTNITCSYNGTNMSIYINGHFDSSAPLTYASNCGSFGSRCYTNILIGEYGASQFTGLIDDVALYSSSLSVKDIQQIYAEGAEKHILVLK